jgi:hypothetical protein
MMRSNIFPMEKMLYTSDKDGDIDLYDGSENR